MANVKLSATELEMVTNAEFILTKNRIIAKVYDLLGELANTYSNKIKSKSILSDEVLKSSPKISRGENYEGLPWVMLDYPRYFTKENAFAIRSFFWWGNFCSITLQLKGRYKEYFSIKSLKLKEEDWFLCCNAEDEWHHHFRQDNYRPLSSFSKEEIDGLTFIKLAKKIPLQEWDNLEIFFTGSFSEILSMLSLTA